MKCDHRTSEAWVAGKGPTMSASASASDGVVPESMEATPGSGSSVTEQPPDPATADGPPSEPSGLRKFLQILGPGLVTGVADDDPSGVATYSQAGATTGVALLWAAPLSLPLMYAVQEVCDRTALATGDSLGALVRRKFERRGSWVVGVLIVSLMVANSLNVAADLAAIGSGMELLHLGPDHVWAAVAGVGLGAALVFGSFERISAVFKWLTLVLLGYVGVLAVAHVPWGAVGAGTIGLRMSWSWDAVGLLVAVLGTTISPYMFFWQSGHRIEQMRAEEGERHSSRPLPERSPKRAARALSHARLDVFVGMLVSTIAMYAIMVSTASTIGRKGPVHLNTAADAAKALEPIAGKWSSAVFAIGFVATGILAVPVLASSGSIALAGLLGKRWGFDQPLRRARTFYILIGIGTLGGVAMALFSSDPVGLLVLSAIINGIAAAPFLVVVMLIAGDRELMGRFRNGRLSSVVGWATAGIMAVAGLVGIYVTVFNPK